MNFRFGAGSKTTSTGSTATVTPPITPPIAAQTPAPQRSTGRVVMPVGQDRSLVLAATMVRAAREIATSCGADGWTSLTIRVGIGFAHIDAHMPNGDVVRCAETSEAFGTARRDLLQRIRDEHRECVPQFVVSVSSHSPRDVRLSLLEQVAIPA